MYRLLFKTLPVYLKPSSWIEVNFSIDKIKSVNGLSIHVTTPLSNLILKSLTGLIQVIKKEEVFKF